MLTEEKTAATLREKQEREFGAWRRWSDASKDDDKQSAIDDFFDSFQPRLQVYKRRMGASPLPPTIIETEIATRALDAFQKYDPSKGAKLNTWIDTNMHGIFRWALDNQNLGRIPSNRHTHIGSFKRAQEDLEYRLGRPPSAAELADELALDILTIEKLIKELRDDLQLTDEISSIMAPQDDDAELKRIVDLIYYELTPEEQTVYDLWFGKHGRPQTSGNDIARAIKKSPSAVSEIKNRIRGKIKHYQSSADRRRFR